MSADRPFCVASARLVWQHGPWVLSWHRRRIGRSRCWLAWPEFRRGIHINAVLKADA